VATVTGESGAWHEIASDIARRGYAVSSPLDLVPLAAELIETRPLAIEAHRAATMKSVQSKSASIASLAAERGFFRQFFNGFKIRALKAEVASLFRTDSRYPVTLDQTIQRIRSLPNSAELAGAEAELAVIEQLRMLPDSFSVFNDLRLRATRHIYFDGAALQSAQLDHVVLTPSAVYVIETKHWSRRFVESGDFHDPFDQSKRAGYLCYDLLRQFGKPPVNTIIACVGSLPDAPADSRVKVLRLDGLRGYILGLHKDAMPSQRLEQVKRFLELQVHR